MCRTDPFRKTGEMMPITAADLTPGRELFRNGYSIRIDATGEDGQVYFVKWLDTSKPGFAQRMPIAEFVRQFNEGGRDAD